MDSEPRASRAPTDDFFPRVREGLTFEAVDGGLVRVTDPQSGKSAQLYEIEAVLARAMDGATRVDNLCDVATQHGSPATLDQMQAFLRQLSSYGLLETPLPEGWRAAEESGAADPETVTEEPAAKPAPAADAGVALPEGEALPAAQNGWQAPTLPGRFDRLRRHSRLIAALAVVAILVCAVRYPLYITEPCVVLPVERRFVRAEVEGLLQTVHVTEGQYVEQGAQLAKLDDRELKAALARIEADLAAAQADLTKHANGARKEEIRRAEAQVGVRQVTHRYAITGLERTTTLFASKVVSQDQLEQAQRQKAIAAKSLSEAEAALKLVLAGSRAEDIEMKRAQVASLEAQRTYLLDKLGRVEVKAPISGTVTTPRIEERKGVMLKVGDEVAAVADLRRARVEIEVAEREVDEVKVGLPVQFRVASYPLMPFRGTVEFISPMAEEKAGRRFLRVVALVENKDALLRQDMRGYGEIDAGSRSLAELGTRRLIRWIRVRFLL